ncbi:PREDICTED: plectin-like [Priapulus caudatus]|uniref:Plectin-like n=1 Tax=Priapulus caudatus TaxID=37621 RepID=A0ABM1F8R7_PRICU|nr:PREDICTED: plectin-like [Priapulus caudatus]
MSELEAREAHFNSVQDAGEELVMRGHPASKAIEAYMATMQTQWSWLLQLTACLETHLRHASTRQRFFAEATECETWMAGGAARLRDEYAKRDRVTLDEGERYLREMHEMRAGMARHEDAIRSLQARARDIVPLPLRRRPLDTPLQVHAICAYKQVHMNVTKDETCTLRDNSQTTKWRVSNSAKQEGMVPAVCFLIPPPDEEAIQKANSLNKQFAQLHTLWREQQRKMKLQMICNHQGCENPGTLKQFMSMEASQREVILAALQEDADKLVAENHGVIDDDMRRLQEEMLYCRELFHTLSTREQARFAEPRH